MHHSVAGVVGPHRVIRRGVGIPFGTSVSELLVLFAHGNRLTLGRWRVSKASTSVATQQGRVDAEMLERPNNRPELGLEPGRTLFDVAALHDELVELLGHEVDVLTSGAVRGTLSRVANEAVPL